MKPDFKRLCPHCGSSELFRSHRRNAVKKYLLRSIGVRRSAVLIAMPDSIGLKHSDGSESPDDPERPNELVLQSLEKI